MLHARKDYDRIQDPAGLIGEDEPVFLIRAKDRSAPHVVRAWAAFASFLGAEEEIIASAEAQAARMLRWQEEHGSQVPDIPPRSGRLYGDVPGDED